LGTNLQQSESLARVRAIDEELKRKKLEEARKQLELHRAQTKEVPKRKMTLDKITKPVIVYDPSQNRVTITQPSTPQSPTTPSTASPSNLPSSSILPNQQSYKSQLTEPTPIETPSQSPPNSTKSETELQQQPQLVKQRSISLFSPNTRNSLRQPSTQKLTPH